MSPQSLSSSPPVVFYPPTTRPSKSPQAQMAIAMKTTPRTMRAHQTTTSTLTQPLTLSRASEMRCSPERTTTGPKLATRTCLRHWKSISVRRVRSLCLDHDPLMRRPIEESLRYLDQHPSLPDDAPPQRKDDFDELRTVLLNNSALAALRVQPPDPILAVHQTTRAYLLAVKTEHKGGSYSSAWPRHACLSGTTPQRKHSTVGHSPRRP